MWQLNCYKFISRFDGRMISERNPAILSVLAAVVFKI